MDKLTIFTSFYSLLFLILSDKYGGEIISTKLKLICYEY